MKIAYISIDDNRADLDRLVNEASKTYELRHLGSFTSAGEAIAFLRQRKSPVPIIFCDIKLREENGLALGPVLAPYCKLLVFVTGLAGQKGNVLDAMGDDHLQKPVTSDQLRSRVIDRFHRRHKEDLPMRIHLNKLHVLHTGDNKYHKTDLMDILFIEHSKNYLDVAVQSGAVYTVREQLFSAYNLIEPAGIFVQINRGTIINMCHIGDWDGTSVMVGERRFALKGKGKIAFVNFIKRNGLGQGGARGGVEG